MLRTAIISALVAGSALVAAAPANAPAPTAAAKLEERASSSCTFTDAAAASKSKTSCSTIVLSSIAVPSGTTLDMTGLKDNTVVTFAGKTTFGYKEWNGPLVSVSGSGITVQGASGAVIDFDGARWWGGQGTNGGKVKPKAFYAHDLTNSHIKNLAVKNTPVQFMSINNAQNLYVDNVSMDNSAGDDQGHNTDAFDVGSSTGVYISGAKIQNQDDCLAINSGTNVWFTGVSRTSTRAGEVVVTDCS